MVDTSRIHSLISRARRRLRLQAALEAATLGAVAGFAAALAVVFTVRMHWIDDSTGVVLLVASGGLVALAALIGAMRRFPTHLVAQRIDRASGLSDRLGTACAFESALAQNSRSASDPETRAMMEAALRDATRALPRANIKAATPFSMPTDLRAAAAFGAVFLLIGGLYLAEKDDGNLLASGIVTLDGKPLPDLDERGEAERGTLIFHHAYTDRVTEIPLGKTGAFRYEKDLRGGPYEITYRPDPIACGVDARQRTTPMPCVAGPIVPAIELGRGFQAAGPSFRLDCGDDNCTLDLDIKRKLLEDPVDFDDDDLDYISELLNDLRHAAHTEDDPSLKEFVERVDQLLAKAERGELTKEQLLEELKKAEDELKANTDTHVEESMADLEKTGQELKKEKLTRELGKALEKGDLEKAQQQMEQLAKKLEDGSLNEKDRQKLAKALEKAAEQFQKREQNKNEKLEKEIQRQQKQVRKMQRQLKQEKNEQKRQEMARRLEKQKRDLQKLQRKKQQREQSQTRRQLKELHRNMERAAENMRNKDQQQQKQASRRMRDMKRNTGKVDSDRRKVRTQKKVASQLTDLKEAMRRAKKRGNRGPKDLFGRNKKNRDFGQRARGLGGKRGAWKPGQGSKGLGKGNKPGQGGKQPGGQGKQPGGDSYGDGHDPNLMGDPTGKGGHTKDESVSGVHGKGPSVRETILSAAQKGFATRSYKQVYANYKSIVEEVMQTEKVPSGYKYYIKKYFQKIKPHSMD